MPGSVNVRAKSLVDIDRTVCPYCRDAIAGRLTHRCAACETVLHLACRQELDGCTTFGCAPSPTPAAEADTRTWRPHVEEPWGVAWMRRPAGERARTAAAWTMLFASLVLVPLFAFCGFGAAGGGIALSLLGAFCGGLLAIPVSAALATYGALQGAIGVPTSPLHNGGYVTLGSMVMAMMVFGSKHVALGVVVAVVLGLICGRLVGYHFDTEA